MTTSDALEAELARLRRENESLRASLGSRPAQAQAQHQQQQQPQQQQEEIPHQPTLLQRALPGLGSTLQADGSAPEATQSHTPPGMRFKQSDPQKPAGSAFVPGNVVEAGPGLALRHTADFVSSTMGQEHVSVFVIGASGDLARKKTFPSLYALLGLGLLPPHTRIYGFARSTMTHEEFITKCVGANLSDEFGDEKRAEFLGMCEYHAGNYNDNEAFAKLAAAAAERESKYERGNRMFYLAIPPSVFAPVMHAISASAMAQTGWTRLIVEKPFGRDLESFRDLQKHVVFTEDQVYRIDHYLGKEMVQNLLVLRFSNAILEPVWNCQYIETVMITFKEPFGTEGRGGYFDQFGIIRDVMQNHLAQIMSLVAMEPPVTMSADDVRDEKVKVLRAVSPAKLSNCVVGQYGRGPDGKRAFIDDDTVPPDSSTATFAMQVLHVHNTRWRGVPFIIKCGKALNERKAEIRIQFKRVGNPYFRATNVNEMVIRVQPDEAVYLKMNAKVPGMSSEEETGATPVVQTELDLTYGTRFDTRLPDAYERLLFDVFRGDHNLFVRDDELEASWKIFTPLLQALEDKENPVRPVIYPYGSRGPPEADELAAKFGFLRQNYAWRNPASL
jgi:glucose-6-phosphate 1-dehydrogenase